MMRESLSFDRRHAPRPSYPENPSAHHLMLFAKEQSSVATPDARTMVRKL